VRADAVDCTCGGERVSISASVLDSLLSAAAKRFVGTVKLIGSSESGIGLSRPILNSVPAQEWRKLTVAIVVRASSRFVQSVLFLIQDVAIILFAFLTSKLMNS